jgi:Flp pilus assembly protein TadG
MEKRHLVLDKRGYSTLLWAVFLSTVLIPLLALTIELSRYFFAAQATANAAESAALAAATEIDKNIYESDGRTTLTSSVYTWAQTAALSSSGSLVSAGVNPKVGQININGTTVRVAVSANLDQLFPSIVPNITIVKNGTAEVQLLKN